MPDDTIDKETAMEIIATSRITESVELLRENRPSEQFNTQHNHTQHIDELEKQAVALLSDAGEVVEKESEYSAARELVNAADTQLASIQDLIVNHEPGVADTVGAVRKKVDEAKGCLSACTES